MADFRIPTDAELAAARRDVTTPRAISARFDRRGGRIRIMLNTGLELSFEAEKIYGLGDASFDDLASISVEGTGRSIHFPRLDADFSVPGLLENFLGPLEWSRREARAAASRENGKRGGRPRKIAFSAC